MLTFQMSVCVLETSDSCPSHVSVIGATNCFLLRVEAGPTGPTSGSVGLVKFHG